MRNKTNWNSLLEASIKFHLQESGGCKLREEKKTSYTSVKSRSIFLIVATELNFKPCLAMQPTVSPDFMSNYQPRSDFASSFYLLIFDSKMKMVAPRDVLKAFGRPNLTRNKNKTNRPDQCSCPFKISGFKIAIQNFYWLCCSLVATYQNIGRFL